MFRRRAKEGLVKVGGRWLDPSDILVACSPSDPMLSAELSDLILDYQGGGLLPRNISALSAPPTSEEDAKCRSVFEEVRETISMIGPNWDMVHLVLISACEREFERPISEMVEAELAVLQSTTEAVCQLARQRELQSASDVLLFGVTLFSRARLWSQG